MQGFARRYSVVLIVAWLLHGDSARAADSSSIFTEY
jgi:hypothetical protein